MQPAQPPDSLAQIRGRADSDPVQREGEGCQGGQVERDAAQLVTRRAVRGKVADGGKAGEGGQERTVERETIA